MRIKEEFSNDKVLKTIKDNILFEKHTSTIKHLSPNKVIVKNRNKIAPNSADDIEMYNDLIIYDDESYIAIELKYKK